LRVRSRPESAPSHRSAPPPSRKRSRSLLPRLSCHDLRHSYATHLIRTGLDVVRVSRQLGHARPSITLDVYAGEFEQAHSGAVDEAVATAFSGILK
jgi:integrase